MKRIFLIILMSIQIITGQTKDTDTILHVEEIEPVVISATMTKRQLSSLPMPALLVSEKEIRYTGAVRLSEILEEQPGIVIDKRLGGTGVQLQGLSSQYVMIMIDGMPLVGRFAGNLDLERVTINDVEQIEIIKGASSGLYGNEALAGVINIITKKPQKGLHSSFSQLWGSYNRFDTSLGLSYRHNKFYISSLLNRNSFGGFKFADSLSYNTIDPYRHYTFQIKGNYKFTSKAMIKSSVRLYQNEQSISWIDAMKGYSKTNEWNTKLAFSYKFNSEWNSTAELYFTRFLNDEYMNHADGSNFYNSNYNQSYQKYNLRLHYKPGNKSDFIFGAGYTKDVLRRNYFSITPVITNLFSFIQWDYKPNDRINLIFGMRGDIHNEYASQISPKLAFHYVLSDEISLKASYGKGFKAPDFRQLFLDFSLPEVGYTILGYNMVPVRVPQMIDEGEVISLLEPIENFETGLQPETSHNFNVGGEFEIKDNLKFNLNLFRNDILNLIDTKVIALKTNGQKVISYININEVYTQGVEITSTYKINPKLKFSASYQYLLAKDKNEENLFKEGKVYIRPNPLDQAIKLSEKDYFGLFNRSRHTARFKIYWDIPKWKVQSGFRVVYRSKYGIYDTNKNGYLDVYDDFVKGHAVLHLTINKAINKYFSFQVGVNNLFNYKDSQNYSRIMGRTLFGKLTIKL